MPSILFKNAKVVDVIDKKIDKRDVLVVDGKIDLSSEVKKPYEVIDLDGAYLAPGFIDGHIHIESSMLTPIEFAKEAVKHGTTSVFADPHEIANVLGVRGVKIFLEQTELLPFSMYIGAPSCVPATSMETSGGEVTLSDIKALLKEENVYGLAEMMDFPDIIAGAGDKRERVKAALEAGKVVDGHAPGLSGDALSSYISNGENDGQVRIGSDHECTNFEEAFEKWEKGMYIMLRYGSSEKDLENILPEVCKKDIRLDRFGLVSDDLSAEDLRERGHINYLIDIATRIIAAKFGLTVEDAGIEAVSMATINHAKYFKKENIGKITHGATADLVVFDSFKKIEPSIVMTKGKIVVRDKQYLGPKPVFNYAMYEHPLRIADNFIEKIVISSKNQSEQVRVIGAVSGSLFTDELIKEIRVDNFIIKPSAESGIRKIAVLERHKRTGNVSVGLIKGFNFHGGAIASTVAHDSHNLIVLGGDEVSMIRAVEIVWTLRGGLAAVFGGEEASLPLSLAGLMSTEGIDTMLSQNRTLDSLIRKMGFEQDPFRTLSFMALPVIPKLKITDKGLVDVDKFDFVDLFVK